MKETNRQIGLPSRDKKTGLIGRKLETKKCDPIVESRDKNDIIGKLGPSESNQLTIFPVVSLSVYTLLIVFQNVFDDIPRLKGGDWTPMTRSEWNVNSMLGNSGNPLSSDYKTISLTRTSNPFSAGAGGGLVASIATCPLDVVKTKLQAQSLARGHADYLGVADTIKTILRRDGIRGLYRGLGPTILGYLPTWAIYFSVYDGIKTRFGEAPLGSVIPQRHVYPAAQPKGYQPTIRDHPWSLHLLSAMTAGACSTICTNPLWVIKTRFMTQPPHERPYRNTLDAFVTIYRSEGFPAFYRGLLPSLLGILHVAVQFPLYEKLRAWAQSRNPGQPLSTPTILLCSAASKMTASVATYPHEVVRTRLQIQKSFRPEIIKDSSAFGNSISPARRKYGGIVHAARRIVSEEGWRGLYKGLSINLFRTVPNSAVTMLTYELLMRHLSARSETPSDD